MMASLSYHTATVQWLINLPNENSDLLFYYWQICLEYIFTYLSLSFVSWFCCFGFVHLMCACRTGPCCAVILHCAGVFSIHFARIDMIVGPPGPSTPRHKKYSTDGPKESPKNSPRLGLTRLSLSSRAYPLVHYLFS